MAAPEANSQNASFRDPGGRVFRSAGRIFRAVHSDASLTLDEFLKTDISAKLQRDGSLAATWQPASLPSDLENLQTRVVEHQPVSFPSYPAEWCPEMLVSVASLTLDLCEALLPLGWGLKDATPYNVLFEGPNPVFIDLLSFEQRDPKDPAWTPYGQFIRTFLLPLMANRDLGYSMRQIWLENRDGLDPERIYPWLPLLRRFSRPALGLVTLPAMMTKKAGGSNVTPRSQAMPPDQATYVLNSLFRGLRADLRRLAPSHPPESHWSDYADTLTHYDSTQRAGKEAFVRKSLAAASPQWTLDMGANTGQFSEIAAEISKVVAVDYDVASVARIYRRAQAKKLNILPLCLDACRPTPGTGWRNLEQPSFLSRCAGRFDMVMMLAVIHHMLVSERVSIDDIVGLAADLTTDHLIIEYVGPEDPMFKILLRGRDALHAGFSSAVFEEALRKRFVIVELHPVTGMDRILYHARLIH